MIEALQREKDSKAPSQVNAYYVLHLHCVRKFHEHPWQHHMQEKKASDLVLEFTAFIPGFHI